MIFRLIYILLIALFFVSTFVNKNNLFNSINSSVETFNIHFNKDIQTLKNEIDFLETTRTILPFSNYKVDGNIAYFDINGSGVYFKNIPSYPYQFSFYNLKESKESLNSQFNNSLLYITYNNIRSFTSDRNIIYTDEFTKTWVKVLQNKSLSLDVFQDKRSISRNNTEFALYNVYVDDTYRETMIAIIFPEYEYFNNYQKLKALWYFDFNGDFFSKNANRMKRNLNLNVLIIDSNHRVVYTTDIAQPTVIKNPTDYYVFPLEKTNYKILVEKETLLQLIKVKEIFLISLILFIIFYMQKKEKLKKELHSLKIINKVKSELLLRDPLTALYNRYFLQEEMKFPIKNCGVVLLDIDYFKSINDTYGHDKGDQVLREVSNCIKLIVQSKSYAFRWGGEEFLIVFRDIDKEKLLNKINSLQVLIRRLNVIDDHKITASFGVFYTDIEDKTSFYSAISEADKKLYIAKKSGRDKVVAF
ncbi:MAG: GGDEF domain-containing protein [Cetobacterium sp.]|uniref:GGDEF domain-containing protein n=1 Tax=Cetobacterium sp. TaxID=2071632 RepID=UPI003F310818